MKRFLLILTFLTRLPIRCTGEFDNNDFIKGITYMPFVGIIIGLILYGFSFISIYIHRPVTALLIWIVYIWVTGGLHIDGLVDSIDGLYSNRDRERVLEIMKDSRIGAFGVIGLMIIFGLNIVLSSYINYKTLILIPIVGRSCGIVACSLSEYAREGEGMGRGFIEFCGLKESIIAILLPIVLVIFGYMFKIASYKLLIPIVASFVFVVYLTNYIKIKIGGMTGDTIGFVIEVSQTAFIIFIYFSSELIMI